MFNGRNAPKCPLRVKHVCHLLVPVKGKRFVTQTHPLLRELLSRQSPTQQSGAIMSSLAVLCNTLPWEMPGFLMHVGVGMCEKLIVPHSVSAHTKTTFQLTLVQSLNE